MEKSALGSFSKVLVSLLIAALVLGCFAGAVSAAEWGKEQNKPKLTLALWICDENSGLVEDISAYVNNNTGSDYLYLSDGKIASFSNISSKYQDNLKGYLLDYNGWMSGFEWSLRSGVFDSDGKLSYSANNLGLTYINQTNTWNYSYNQDVTLYGWLYANTTYISLDPNGGSFIGLEEYKDEYSGYSWSITDPLDGLLISTGEQCIDYEGDYINPTKYGYKFAGWATDKQGETVIANEYVLESENFGHLPLIAEGSGDGYKIVSDGDSVKWIALDNENSVTLYAKWEKITEQLPTSSGSKNKVIVIGGLDSGDRTKPGIDYLYITFDANSGDGDMEEQQFAPGYTHALHLNEFTKEGFIFTGWALEPTGTVYYEDGQEVTLEEDITIYAVWVAEESDSGIPLWLIILIIIIVLIIIAVLIYLFAIRQK